MAWLLLCDGIDEAMTGMMSNWMIMMPCHSAAAASKSNRRNRHNGTRRHHGRKECGERAMGAQWLGCTVGSFSQAGRKKAVVAFPSSISDEEDPIRAAASSCFLLAGTHTKRLDTEIHTLMHAQGRAEEQCRRPRRRRSGQWYSMSRSSAAAW